MRKTTVRRTRTDDVNRTRTIRPAAATVLPALLLVAACSSGSSGSSGASDSSSSDGESHVPLTKAQLTSAVVTDEDMPGWAVQVSRTDDSADESTLTADKPQCQPLADVTSSKPKIHRVAFVGAAFAKTGTGAQDDAINQMLVASHAPGDAKKVVDSVKTALGRCAAFTATDDKGSKTPFAVSAGPAVPTGDEAVSYVMTDTSDKKSGAALVTVVRTGDTVTAYLSVKSSGGAGDLPIEVAREQNDKLKAALGKR